MNIDINFIGIGFEKYKIRRNGIGRDYVFIGLGYRFMKIRMSDISVIDKEKLFSKSLFCKLRFPDKAFNIYQCCFCIERDETLIEVFP